MATLLFKKVNTLPATPTADTLYILNSGTGVNLYISNSAGTALLPVQDPDAGDNVDPFLLMGVIGDN